MKFLMFCIATFVFLKTEAGPTDLISRDMPDVLLETSQQGIICRREIGFAGQGLQEMDIDGILPENDENFNKYFGCIWKKKGIVNEEADVDLSNFSRYLEELFTLGGELTPTVKSLVDASANQCKDEGGVNYGQKAVKMNNCVIRYLQESVKSD